MQSSLENHLSEARLALEVHENSTAKVSTNESELQALLLAY